MKPKLPLGEILHGDCIEIMANLPAESVDMVFADPPYNLQLHQELWRPNLTKVEAVDESWDQFSNFEEYDRFTYAWLQACRRLMKPNATLWVIGTYHNIFRVGKIMQDLGYWILNDVIWVKSNPMPNFRGVRLTNAHETMIWAQKERGATYTFNYQAMKSLNGDLQMRSDWHLPLCSGKERLRIAGEKAHPTQKPEALLYRVILASTKPGDVVLDPFFGTGTTGAVAKRLRRDWIGIEGEARYVDLAGARLAAIQTSQEDEEVFATPNPRKRARIPFGLLLEQGMIQPGQPLYFGPKSEHIARVMADGSLEYNGRRGSIHQIAKFIRQAPCNGWEQWYYLDPLTGERRSINYLRSKLRKGLAGS